MNLKLEAALMAATNAQELARGVIVAIKNHESVTLDFAAVEIMTPSFVNTFVMMLLEERPTSDVRELCCMINMSQSVTEAFRRATERWARGVRLSNQMIPA